MKDIKNNKLKDGKFGNIYKSFDNELKKNVLIKKIEISNNKKLSLIEKDIENMNQINSKYSIKLLKNYKEKNYYFLVFDFFEDNLENYMEKNKLNDNQITKLLFQLNNYLLEIAIKNIIYLNLKPKNIFIKFKNENDKNDFDIKIAYYGLNTKIDPIKKNDEFIAPEMFKKKITNKSDLFSIGKLLYFLFYNSLPIKNNIIECDNEDLKNLINNLIIGDYNQRLNWNQYFEHPFFIPYYIKFLKENMTDFNHDNQTHDIIFSNIQFKDKIYKYLGETLKETKTFDGKGILFDEEGDKKYEGDFKDNKFNGKGILYYKNGNKRYDGLWKNNICDGEGTLFNINGTKKHEGLIKNGVVEGKGIIYYDNGKIKYEGDIKDDKSNGKGKEYYENGNLKYEGDFLNNKWNGKGVYYN
jgi:serine/threonine protein kinase